MKRLLIAIALAVVVPACHSSRPATVVGAPPEPVPPAPTPPPVTTSLLVQATNFDIADYALWIEWQNETTGIWEMAYLFSVFGPSTNYEIVDANPSVLYYVLLADLWGNVYDFYPLTIPAVSAVDVTFDIVDGYLYRTP